MEPTTSTGPGYPQQTMGTMGTTTAPMGTPMTGPGMMGQPSTLGPQTASTAIQPVTKESKRVVEVRPVDKVDLFVVISFLFVMGSVVLIQAARLCHREKEADIGQICHRETAFAIVVGALGVLFSLIFALCLLLPVTICQYCCQVLGCLNAALWTAGAGVCTFVMPFTVVSNEYFALWLGFTASFYFLYLVTPEVDRFFDSLAVLSRTRDIDHRTVVAILFASVIFLTSISVNCHLLHEQGHKCVKQDGWEIAVGSFSVFWTLVYLLLFRFLAPFRAFFAILLLLVWIPGCGVAVFQKPFVVPGNGFFSAWVAFLFTGYWTIKALFRSP